ncbi:hypothetical protein VE01_04970 [Pseudogymnoascus verrucosus]|uniref:Uncharacterized protein n=1 Tax=Pseudogymnoascus verrucosus TaxID=342668 RepID=A0A1B8GPH9_9PEZI|nr:uncharacterized protein VE01_04970 [Pseudogymnoascus verrucosus]OBT97749.1 hypothetical protein VE01_04970 [Pseudogymnoascus verrucosus]
MATPPNSPLKVIESRQEPELDKNAVFASKELFDKTATRLQASKKAGVWSDPKIDGSLAVNLNNELDIPTYIPMAHYIAGNWLGNGEEAAAPVEPNVSIAVPATSLKLAKAIELMHHSMPASEIRNCFPKHVTKFGKRDTVFAFYETKLKEHASAITRATLERGFLLSCSVIDIAMNSGDFFQQMQHEDELHRISTINQYIRPEHIHFMFSDQFKAVSYNFVFHNAVRANLQEEELRIDLRKYLRFTTCHIIYDFLRFVISVKEGDDKDFIDKNGIGRMFVRNNYYIMPGGGPAGEVSKNLKRLPAADGFDTHSRTRSIGGTTTVKKTGWDASNYA